MSYNNANNDSQKEKGSEYGEAGLCVLERTETWTLSDSNTIIHVSLLVQYQIELHANTLAYPVLSDCMHPVLCKVTTEALTN